MGLCPVLAGVGACPAVALRIAVPSSVVDTPNNPSSGFFGGIAERWLDQIVREIFPNLDCLGYPSTAVPHGISPLVCHAFHHIILSQLNRIASLAV